MDAIADKSRKFRIAIMLNLVPGGVRQALSGIRQYAREQGNWIIQAHQNVGLEPLSDLQSWTGDGIIGTLPEHFQAEELVDRGIPFVSICSGPKQEGLARITVDHEGIGRAAADHLLQLGLRHLAFFGAGKFFSQARLTAFQERLAQRGRDCQVLDAPLPWQPSPQVWSAYREELRRWLLELPTPCGLFVADDEHAVIIYDLCDEIGLRIPDDIALIGANDDDLICTMVPVPLTSVDPNSAEHGYEAARLLDRLMQGAPVPREPITVPISGVVERESTSIVAVEDAVVKEAVLHIRQHAGERPVSVSELCGVVGLSRSALISRFRASLGRPPKAEISNVRLQRAQELLLETDWSIKRISDSMDFTSAEELSRFFRNQTGQSPTEFRRLTPV